VRTLAGALDVGDEEDDGVVMDQAGVVNKRLLFESALKDEMGVARTPDRFFLAAKAFLMLILGVVVVVVVISVVFAPVAALVTEWISGDKEEEVAE
jgi:hypothetical protein